MGRPKSTALRHAGRRPQQGTAQVQHRQHARTHIHEEAMRVQRGSSEGPTTVQVRVQGVNGGAVHPPLDGEDAPGPSGALGMQGSNTAASCGSQVLVPCCAAAEQQAWWTHCAKLKCVPFGVTNQSPARRDNEPSHGGGREEGGGVKGCTGWL